MRLVPTLLQRSARATTLLLLAGAVCPALHAQFTLQDSGTTADLRGIVNVGNGTAWASGTHGTVLRTEDSGFVWQGCAVPPGAEQLDFRGIQAFDDQTAIVMSSGKGDLSRVYKTTDGCTTWKLVFTNPDAEGFFDGLLMNPPDFEVLSKSSSQSAALSDYGVIVGDPVNGVFSIFLTFDRGAHWERMKGRPAALPGEGLFAASNQAASWSTEPNSFLFVTGGTSGSRLFRFETCGDFISKDCATRYQHPQGGPYAGGIGSPFTRGWDVSALSFPRAISAGAFAVSETYFNRNFSRVVVGGDYARPQSTEKTADTEVGARGRWIAWTPASRPPHGYRSSVAYDPVTKAWITVGPNGTDVSTDDGRNWHPLKPGYGDDPNADKQWNALSLPYVVGPHGRIGRLREDALKPGK